MLVAYGNENGEIHTSLILVAFNNNKRCRAVTHE